MSPAQTILAAILIKNAQDENAYSRFRAPPLNHNWIHQQRANAANKLIQKHYPGPGRVPDGSLLTGLHAMQNRNSPEEAISAARDLLGDDRYDTEIAGYAPDNRGVLPGLVIDGFNIMNPAYPRIGSPLSKYRDAAELYAQE